MDYIDLRKVKEEKRRNSYFKSVRNEQSVLKRVATYATVGAIAGFVGGLVILMPAALAVAAVGPAVLPYVTTNIVYGTATVVPPLLAQHYGVLRKDNKLGKAERKIQSAAKLQLKLMSGKLSDKKYNRLINKRDNKLEYFNSVYASYQRKTQKLARKLNARYDLKTKELIENDTERTGLFAGFTDKGSFLYNRNLKKFNKASKILENLEDDKIKFEKIRAGVSAHEYKKYLEENKKMPKVIKAAKGFGSKASALKDGLKSASTYVYGTSKGAITRAKTKLGVMLSKGKAAPVDFSYVRRDSDDLSLLEQLRMSFQTEAIQRDENKILPFFFKKNNAFVLQPRKIKNPLLTKNDYLELLQNESIKVTPFVVSNKVELSDYVKFYFGTNFEDKANNICKNLLLAEKEFENAQKFMQVNSMNTLTNNTKYRIQYDFDNPKISITKEFDEIQDGLIYTRFIQSIATKLLKDKQCDSFRVSTWQKQPLMPYVPITEFSVFAENEEQLVDINEKMRNSFMKEFKNLQRNDYLVNAKPSKLTTVELVQEIEKMSKNGDYKIKDIENIYSKLPQYDINSYIGDTILPDGTSFMEREKEYFRNQFSPSIRENEKNRTNA